MFLRNALLSGASIAYAPADEGGGDSAPLSVEAASALIEGVANEPGAEDGDQGETPQETTQDDDLGDENQDPDPDASAGEDADDGDETPADGDEEGEETPAAGNRAPPLYWQPEAKEAFAALPEHLQDAILAQEGPREAAAAKAKEEARLTVEAIQKERRGIQTLAEQLGSFLPEAIQTFQQRWGEPDWEATIQQYGAEQAAILKARYEKEQVQLQRLSAEAQTAQQQAHQAFMLEQFNALTKIDPVLAPDPVDPRKGSEERQKVTKYILEAGIPQEAVAHISAVELALARKAMLWDAAQAAKNNPKIPAKPVQQQAPRRPTPKPGARPGQSAGAPQQTQGKASAQGRFNAAPTIDNAVALLLARK